MGETGRATVCNLDVFLASLCRQLPAARVIVSKEQAQYYIPLLVARFALHAAATLPATAVEVETRPCADAASR